MVWLTSHADPGDGSAHGLDMDPTLKMLSDYNQIDKSRIRIEVEVPKSRVTKFVDFARSAGVSREWLAHIAASGKMYSWWVSTRILTMHDWVEVRDMQDTAKDKNGRILWYRDGGKQVTQKDFRGLLEKHGRPMESGARVERKLYPGAKKNQKNRKVKK